MTGFRDLQGQMSEIVQLLKQSSQQHPQPGIPQPTMRVGAQGQMGAYGFGQPSAGVPPQMSEIRGGVDSDLPRLHQARRPMLGLSRTSGTRGTPVVELGRQLARVGLSSMKIGISLGQ